MKKTNLVRTLMEMAGCLKAVLLVLHLLFLIVSSEEWYSLNVRSHASTPYEVLKHHLKTFDTKGIKTGYYSLLSVDQQNNHLLVGAKNVAILLDLEDIDSYVLWNVTTPSSSSTCDKEKDDLCNNYIMAMLPFEDRIYLCWTGKAPSAACSWRNRTNLSAAPGNDSLGNVFKSDAKDFVPRISPYQNDTAVITERGILFTGTISPNTGKSMIYSRSFNPTLNPTYSHISQGWFYSDVHFIKSFDIGLYVYFFFRERSYECASCGRQVSSRVARICKGDYGGYHGHQRTFVTFQKAKLSCSDGKDYPVNFNEIQDVWWDEPTDEFRAIFTSHRNGPPASAVCVYSLSSIKKIFVESKFKSFSSNGEGTTVDNNYPEYFPNCKVNPLYINQASQLPVPDGMMATQKMTINAYTSLMHDPLMADPVQPTSSRAWFIKDGIRMTAIAVEKVGANKVVYTSTDRGTVLKISQPEGNNDPCLLTEMDAFPVGKKEIIRSMALDTKRHTLYLGSSSRLAKLSLEQCGSYLNNGSCISAADPYCGWDNKTKSCVSVLSHGEPSQLKQDLNSCPKAQGVSWSPWKNCLQSDGNLCRCQVRPCLQDTNSHCEGGLEYRLENCTVNISVGWEGVESWEALGVQHGNWSVWGNWSECSAKAWAGVRNRSRTCTNPVPRRGGRPCLGDSVQYEPCSLGLEEVEKSLSTNLTKELNPKVNMAVRFHVKCRAKGYKLTAVSAEVTNETIDCQKEPQICGDGEWNPWGEWTPCTVEGFQIRRRNCKREPCVGESLQEQSCSPPPTKCEDDSWDEWSKCVCDHNLPDVETGLRYRVLKCCRLCPNQTSCCHTVEFGDCSCKTTSVVGRRTAPNVLEKSNFGLGHVIGAAVIGCVFTITLCVAAICFVNRRKKQFDVSKMGDNSLNETGNDSRYSTLPARENVELLKNSGTPGINDKNRNSSKKTPSPLKIMFEKRKKRYPVNSYREEEV